jgi:hypothetical protein
MGLYINLSIANQIITNRPLFWTAINRHDPKKDIFQMFYLGMIQRKTFFKCFTWGYDTQRGRSTAVGLTSSAAKLLSLASVFARSGIQPQDTTGAVVSSVRDESTRHGWPRARFRRPSLPICQNRRRIPLLTRLVCLYCNLLCLQLLSASLSNFIY